LQLDEHGEERVIHGLRRTDTYQRFSVAPLDREAGSLQRRAQVDASGDIRLARCKPNLEILARLHGDDFDLRIEWLT